MGISFKVSKAGKRFHPKSPSPGAASFPVEVEESDDVVVAASKKTSDSILFSTRKLVGEASANHGIAEISDNEVSFCLNLFPDGYSIAKPMESESGRQASVDVPKFLHPYDRASESLFSAIESGRLPGDILDDIPCKYMNGTLVCEVRDYRKCSSEGHNVASGDSSPPVINRVRLRMSLENIVKDIPAISDNDWTYGDLMEVESRILKALQPQLRLNPIPLLDRLSDNPSSTKCSWGNKPTPPGTTSNPLPPPAPATLQGISAVDLLAYDRQLAMGKMGGVHTLMHHPQQGQHHALRQASMGMGAGVSQAIYDGGFQNQQLMYYQ